MASFQELTAELTGRLPGLSPFLAEKFVNDAWRTIRGERRWSWQYGDLGISLPAEITIGSATVTQFSLSVTLNAAAAAAVNAIPTGGPQITDLQFRAVGGALYNITAWNSPVLTLDRIYLDVTTVGVSYQIYRAYIPAPVSDFVRWTSIVDPVNGYDLELDHTRQEVDLIDPQRMSQDQPLWVASYKLNEQTDDAFPLFEFWPHATVAGNLLGFFERRGADLLQPTDTLPPIVSRELVMQCALGQHAYPWAWSAQTQFPNLKGPNWGFLINNAMEQYNGNGNPRKAKDSLLQQAKRQDDETYNTSRIMKRVRSRVSQTGPIDSKYMQSHAMWPR